MVEPRVMLIAGGTGAIGRVIARHALAAGWKVAIQGSSEISVEECMRDLQARAGMLKGFAADIRQPQAIHSFVEQTAVWAGRVDAVVDCMAAGPDQKRIAGAFADTEPEGYGEFLDLSVAHLQRLAHAALPWLRRQGGTVIAFASDAGRFAAPRQALVASSRAAIMAFIRNLALETAGDGVRAHCVSPSFVAGTESAERLSAQSAERMAKAEHRAGLGLPTPDDIAPLVMFLCGDGARKITGQVISVNGGMNA